jgi:hypothetical protein
VSKTSIFIILRGLLSILIWIFFLIISNPGLGFLSDGIFLGVLLVSVFETKALSYWWISYELKQSVRFLLLYSSFLLFDTPGSCCKYLSEMSCDFYESNCFTVCDSSFCSSTRLSDAFYFNWSLERSVYSNFLTPVESLDLKSSRCDFLSR